MRLDTSLRSFTRGIIVISLLALLLVVSGCRTAGDAEEAESPATILKVARIEWDTGQIDAQVVATVRGLTPQVGEMVSLFKVGASLGVATILSVSEDISTVRLRLEEESIIANLGSLIAVSDLLEAQRYDGEVLQTGASGNING